MRNKRNGVLVLSAVVVLILVASAAMGGAKSSTSEESSAPLSTTTRVSPLRGATLMHETRVGIATTVIQVRGYTYVEVEAAGEVIWVATLKRPIIVGATVNARLISSRRHFRSTQLQRDFDTLYFGIVTSSEVTPDEVVPAPPWRTGR